jgi:hypothetical protein
MTDQTFETQKASTCDLSRQRLGPAPHLTLAALVDLGLSDDRIGRYFKLDAACISTLRAEYLAAAPQQ